MASASEQIAASFNFGAIKQAKELRQRLLFVALALIVFRLGTFIPVPGIDIVAFQQLFDDQAARGIVGMFDTFSGGALSRMSIFALGIMPYISAVIIMNLMTAVSPKLDAMKKEGGKGTQKYNQYTRYFALVLCVGQSYGVSVGLEGMQTTGGVFPVLDPGLFFRLVTVVTLTGGTMFLLWLGEQITERGVGNGVSMIIFSGIVANLPGAVATALNLGRSDGFVVFLLFLAILLLGFIVFIERSQRRLIVQYPKRQHGNKQFGGQSSHLPIKINAAGVIPPIFASSLMLMPLTAISMSGGGAEWLTWITANFVRGSAPYLAVYAALIMFFAYFYTGIVFNADDVADNLKKQGGFIPGIRPGLATADYLRYILNRLTVVGSSYLALVAIVPELLIAKYAVPFYLGGTSLLIVVSVTMDFVAQVQSHLIAHQYEGLIKKAKLGKGRR